MMATANQSKKENMIWGLSLQGWEDVMRLSLVFAGGAAVFIGLSTWFVVKLQRDEIRLSNERIATSELETARLKKELGPRNLNWNDFVMAIKGAAQVQLEILYVADQPIRWNWRSKYN
jgi:hypothetical protein